MDLPADFADDIRFYLGNLSVKICVLCGQTSKLILTLGEKQLPRFFKIVVRHEHVGLAIEITVIRLRRVHEFLRRRDAVFFQHHHEQLRFDDRAGEENFHACI